MRATTPFGPTVHFGGGFADGLVQEVHDLLGIPQDGRRSSRLF